MRKLSGKFEKMQFVGHLWGFFENIDFEVSTPMHLLAATIFKLLGI